LPKQVNDHHGSRKTIDVGAGAQLAGEQVWIHVPGLAFTVQEDRTTAEIYDWICRRNKSKGLAEYLVAGFNT
jgi:hypothetical protein